MVTMDSCISKNAAPTPSVQVTDRVQRIEDVIAFFPRSAEDIKSRTELYVQETKRDLSSFIAIPDDKRTWHNTVLEFDRICSLSNLATWGSVLCLFEQVSPDESIRNAAHEALKVVQAFLVDEISANKPLYNALKAYAQGNALKESLDETQRYILKDIIDDYVRAGLDLPEEQLEKVRQIKKELANLSLEFSQNIAADNKFITVGREDLAGLDDAFINALEKTEDGKYKLGVDYPTYFKTLETCTVPSTRRALFLAFNSRAYPVNDAVLKQIADKRDDLAHLLGFESYAHLDLDSQMVKHPDRAYAFLHDIMNKALEKDKQEFETFIKDMPESVVLTPDGKLNPWDFMFLKNAYKKRYLAVDEELISQYFPMEKTIEGLLAIYSSFMNVQFEEAKAEGLWHPEVRLIKVLNKDKTQLLGYIFLDLYPRPNKYNHAAHFGMIPAFTRQDGMRMPDVSTLVTNFPSPTADRPSLMRRDDVRTFFHEFGHALHAVLGASSVASYSGTSVKRDFVELPSQILEEWLWDKEILTMVSGHYQTGEKLPDDLIEAILALKTYDLGGYLTRQASLALMSLDVFAAGKGKDPFAIWQRLKSTYRPYIASEYADYHHASFGHLTGYGAKYYGYLWSLVFAMDVFDTINEAGLLNGTIGQRYIDYIIGKGGTQDPNEMLKAFLGREPNSDAFFKELGL